MPLAQSGRFFAVAQNDNEFKIQIDHFYLDVKRFTSYLSHFTQ
jgi:hypothetical protein